MNIGNVLDDMGNPEEALVELKKGLDVLVFVYNSIQAVFGFLLVTYIERWGCLVFCVHFWSWVGGR